MQSFTPDQLLLGLVVLVSGFILLRFSSSGRITNEQFKRVLGTTPEQRQQPRQWSWKLPVGVILASVGLVLPVVLSTFNGGNAKFQAPIATSVAHNEKPPVAVLDDDTLQRLKNDWGFQPSELNTVIDRLSAGSSPIDRELLMDRSRAILNALYGTDDRTALNNEAVANEIKALRLMETAPSHPEDSNANFSVVSVEMTMRVLSDDRKSISFDELYHLKIDESEPKRKAGWRKEQNFRVFVLPCTLGSEPMTTEAARDLLDVTWGASENGMDRVEKQDSNAKLEKFRTKSVETTSFLLVGTIPLKYLEKTNGEAYVNVHASRVTQRFPFSHASFEAQRFIHGVDKFVARIITNEKDKKRSPGIGRLEAIGFRITDPAIEGPFMPWFDDKEGRWVYLVEEHRKDALQRILSFSYPWTQLTTDRSSPRQALH